MMGLACCEVQCGASASTAGGGIVERSLIFLRTFLCRPAYHLPSCRRLFRPASRLASLFLLLFHPAVRRRRPSPPVHLPKRRSRSGSYPSHEFRPRPSFRAPPNRCPPPSPMFHPQRMARARQPVSRRHSAAFRRRLRRAHSRPASTAHRTFLPPPKLALSCYSGPPPASPCLPSRPS